MRRRLLNYSTHDIPSFQTRILDTSSYQTRLKPLTLCLDKDLLHIQVGRGHFGNRNDEGD